MSIQKAIIDKFLTLSPDESVENAVKSLKKAKVEAAPVTDNDGRLLGLFTTQILMKNLLPVSVPMNDGIVLDVKVRAAPGIAKRLNRVNMLRVSDLMERKVNVVAPETPIWEAVNFLVQYGAPLIVVDQQSAQAVGIITTQSMLDELDRQKDID